MAYLKDLPAGLEEYGLSKTFLVRRETIHLKHILTVLFGDEGICDNHSLLDYMQRFTHVMRHLYNISREYNHPVTDILNADKGKFDEYLPLFHQLGVIIFVDEKLPYHFIQNFKQYHSDYNVIVTPLAAISLYQQNLFNFIVAADDTNLKSFWLYGFKTFYYKNKRIKNFSLYDKQKS